MELSKYLDAMDRNARLIHILICVVIGGVVAYFSSIKWLAASLWVSASLFFNGSLAYYEDALPGGFDNPNGRHTPAFVQGFGALRFWASSLAITMALAMAGFLVQRYT